MAAYISLMNGDCAEALEWTQDLSGTTRRLYRAAANACLAAFEGKSKMWDRAEMEFRGLSRESLQFCTDRKVHDLVEDLLSLHRGHPDALLQMGSSAPGRLPCPRLISVTPEHGPADGGYLVRAEGEFLPRSLTIEFNMEHRREVRPDASGTFVEFAMPSAAELGSSAGLEVQIQTVDWPEWGWAHFTYEDEATPAPSEAHSSSSGERDATAVPTHVFARKP